MNVAEPDCGKARPHLTEHMGYPLISVAAADVGDPFPEDCSVDQSVAPECSREGGTTLAEFEQVAVRNERDPCRRERSQAVIHHLDVQTLQVRHIPWGMEGQDLPPD